MKNKALISLVLGVVLLAGCTAQQWFTAIAAIIPIAEQTITSFVIADGALSFSSAQVIKLDNYTTLVAKSFQDVSTDVASWTSTTNLNTANKVLTEMQNIQVQSQGIISSLSLSTNQLAEANAIEAFITVVNEDAADIINIIPALNGQPVADLKTAARITGWSESDFQLEKRTNASGKEVTVAVVTPAKLRVIKERFAERHNNLRKFKTGNPQVDAVMSHIKPVAGPHKVFNLIP